MSLEPGTAVSHESRIRASGHAPPVATSCARVGATRGVSSTGLRLLLALFVASTALGACRRSERATPTESSSSPALASNAPVSRAAPVGAMNQLANADVQWPEGQNAGERRPLLLLLHGLGDSGQNFARSSDWIRFANARRIAWVSPDGSFDHTGRRFWNAGPSCCNFDEIPVDHLAALRELLSGALATGRVDPDKVFVVGFSNGGYMAHRLACELGGMVKAVVSIAGAGPIAAVPCPATTPVRVLQVHGDADNVVSYEGGKRIRNGALREYLSARKTVGDWAARLGCDPAPKSLSPLDFERRLPAQETRVERFERCERGAVELWTVQGGRHTIGFHEPAQTAIWQFLDPS